MEKAEWASATSSVEGVLQFLSAFLLTSSQDLSSPLPHLGALEVLDKQTTATTNSVAGHAVTGHVPSICLAHFLPRERGRRRRWFSVLLSCPPLLTLAWVWHHALLFD